MLSDEEKEIFNNLKDYMQSNIDNGYHKFIYNDLGWDFECIDCINAIDTVLKQSKEIEELKENNCVYKDTSSCTKSLSLKTYTELNNYISKEEAEQKEKEAYIKGTNNAHELCNKKWEDKIEAETEKVENALKMRKELEYIDKEKYTFAINRLQSLLEKE